jgi:putative DNA primase/helicase
MRTGADFLRDEDEKATDEAADGDGPRESAARVELIRGDAMTPVPIDWIWRGYLARGKLELIAGAPESGKTTIAIDFGATVTRGGTWPDGSPAPAGDVLIWSDEDDWTDTLLPRLIACGADLRRVYNIAAVVDEHGNKLPFDPARDIPVLLTAAKKHPALAMMIIDPVVSAITGDGHKNTEVRRGLQPISAMAEQLKIVVLGITHFTKGTSGKDPIERVTGSLAFGAAARLVMVTVSPKEPGEKRCLIRGKSNIGPCGGGYKYELAPQRITGTRHC